MDGRLFLYPIIKTPGYRPISGGFACNIDLFSQADQRHSLLSSKGDSKFFTFVVKKMRHA